LLKASSILDGGYPAQDTADRKIEPSYLAALVWAVAKIGMDESNHYKKDA
jgi:hypothetical protein